jgi:hypothetical protein
VYGLWSKVISRVGREIEDQDMSFNAQVNGQRQDDRAINNPILNVATTRTKGQGTGVIPSLPLVNSVTAKVPTQLLFLSIPYRTQTQINSQGIANATSIGLSQILMTGITGASGPGVVAVEFDSAHSDSLQPKTLHNLDNVHNNVLFFYYDNNAGQILQAAFGGDYVTVWERRSADNVKWAKLKLIEVSTGTELQYTDAFLWMTSSSHTWQ